MERNEVLKKMAEEFAGAFETKYRTPGDEDTRYVSLKSDVEHREDWQTICREAHGDMLPDDWKYEAISKAADYLSENDPERWDDLCYEFTANHVDVYYSELGAWIGSHSERFGYCDEASKTGMGVVAHDTTDLIQAGQREELSEIYAAVVAGLNNLCDAETEYGFNTNYEES